MSDYVELTGDDLPYHLRDDAPPLAECNRCHRKTWDGDEVGRQDRMPQPDGNPCGGRLLAPQTPTKRGDAQGWVDRSRPVAADRRAPAAPTQVPVSPPTEGKTPGAEPRLGTGAPLVDLIPTVVNPDGTVDDIECCASGSCEVCRR